MKTNLFASLAFMTCATLLSSCTESSNNMDVDPTDGLMLSGSITQKLSLDATKEYLLNGTLIIEEGGELEIPAGTTIRAAKGFSNYILVLQGGKIFANGTEDAPITFTADVSGAKQGHWGGLIINGKAPISGANASNNEGLTEVNNAYVYGGDLPNDHSGMLKYVKLLYTGARSSGNVEHNGLTLNGVGNGTIIENIYIAEGADDAIEFFGGTVDVKNLLAVNPDDDMFDFTQGYSGTVSNCYGVWEKGYVSSEEDPRGIEADGNLDGNGPDHHHQSDFAVENMTIDQRAMGAEVFMHDAIKVRRGAKATITNALVLGQGIVNDLIDLTDKKGNAHKETSISLTNNLSNPITGESHKGDGIINLDNSQTGCDRSLFEWTKYSF